MRHLIVRSRNTSCRPLKELVVPVCTIYRMGSTTPIERILRNPRQRFIEINSIEGCLTSSNKIKMKKAFDLANIQHAQWFHITNLDTKDRVFRNKLSEYGVIIAKHIHSSKGKGIYLIQNLNDFNNIPGDIREYVFERYYTYSREYRIHVTKDGCFYASRKMLLTGAEDRWHRHSNNSVFINEENPQFSKPSTWNEIVDDCIKALKQMNLDIAAFDIKVSRNGDWIVLESNTAPSLKENGLEKYKLALTNIIDSKNGRF